MERSIISTKIAFRPLTIVAVAYLLILTGCASKPRRYRSEIHPYQTEPFQENSIDLSQYKSPQMRVSGQDPNTAFAIAISGGGHRATNFGTGVLIELEKITNATAGKSNALNEIDYFSTVSGGGLAAAAYISSLHDHIFFNPDNDQNIPKYSFADIILNGDHSSHQDHASSPYCVSDPMLKDHLSHGYHKDLLDGLFAWTGATRGEFLERAFDNEILGRRWRKAKLLNSHGKLTRTPSLTLGDVFISRTEIDRSVTVPYWITNATVYENGSIFPFTPDFLKLYMISGYMHRLK
jgi:hypothetical protein